MRQGKVLQRHCKKIAQQWRPNGTALVAKHMQAASQESRAAVTFGPPTTCKLLSSRMLRELPGIHNKQKKIRRSRDDAEAGSDLTCRHIARPALLWHCTNQRGYSQEGLNMLFSMSCHAIFAFDQAIASCQLLGPSKCPSIAAYPRW